MSALEKAARQALDALENLGWHGSERERDEAIKSLERALAQQAEPVAMSASGTKEAAFIGGKLYHIDPRQAQWIEDRLGVVQAEPVDKALTKPAPQVDKEQAEPVVEPHKPATSPDNGQFMSHDGNASY